VQSHAAQVIDDKPARQATCQSAPEGTMPVLSIAAARNRPKHGHVGRVADFVKDPRSVPARMVTYPHRATHRWSPAFRPSSRFAADNILVWFRQQVHAPGNKLSEHRQVCRLLAHFSRKRRPTGWCSERCKELGVDPPQPGALVTRQFQGRAHQFSGICPLHDDG
jgi:hypothetical protein